MKLYIPINTKVYPFDECMVVKDNFSFLNVDRVKTLYSYSNISYKHSYFYSVCVGPYSSLAYEYVIPYMYILEMYK
jgi:hypothetical protein